MRRLLFFAALAIAPALAAQSARRPIILLVHGRGMLGRDTALTRKLWHEGLVSGGRTLTREPFIDESDVRVAWYADVLDPRSAESCSFDASDLRVQRDAAIDPNLKSFVSAAGSLLSVLTGIVQDTSSGSELRALASDAQFLSDAHKRCAAERRLMNEVQRARADGRPIIVVAHSLGSLVAYDYLSTLKERGVVAELITIGSPVGSPDLRRLLIGGDESDTLALPRSVVEWKNIRNDGDPFASAIPVATNTLVKPPADELDPHEMVGYLRGTETARAVLSAWCAALDGSRPRGCEALRPPR